MTDFAYDREVERYEEMRRLFLEAIHEPLRGHFGVLVSKLLKQLEEWEPQALLTLVTCTLQERAARATDVAMRQRLEYFLTALQQHPALALGYMDWAIWWDGREEWLKESIKARRWQDIQQAEVDPTDAQLAYLKRLGHVGEVKSMAHARRLIEEYVAVKAGTL